MLTSTLIGLTGGIACGKSTVAAMLTARGARVVDADAISRAITAPGSEGLAAVVSAFGEEVLDAEGRLDRARLGQRVFSDPAARRQLETITHPRIAAASMSALREAARAGPPLVVYDAALLIEAGRADAFRPLVVVTAPEATQRARLMARDGLDEAAAQARLDSQMPVARKAALADYVIDNGGSLEATRAQVEALWRRLVS